MNSWEIRILILMKVIKLIFFDVCKRINEYFKYFLIKDTSRVRINESEESIFNYFKEYIDYNKSDNIYNKCISEIKYIERKFFSTIGNLYDIYDAYETVIQAISSNFVDSLICEKIENLFDNYNKIIEIDIIKDDNFFLNELYNIRCLIENNEWVSKYNCPPKLPALSNVYGSITYTKTSNVFTDFGKYFRLHIERKRRKMKYLMNKSYEHQMWKPENHNPFSGEKKYNIYI
ncbi:variable surface protein [Plasmodium gonderi]|uniref:Variable surface protein n=1 Tax=Plasmodium gonderi TaxID=77519 RepID=A0A1Y1JQ27_PLAGO|nr:variable surface protein [Plasmodium gonderi]GAW84519.1 variable surface protein [Plasmodium gonderi]